MVSKKKLVIIGANEFQEPLIKRANEMNFETHVFAWEDGAVGKDIADYFYPISITEMEEIYQISKKINPVGVVTIASDLASITVQYVAERLGLPCNSLNCVEMTTNKFKMREALQDSGIYVPRFELVKDACELAEVKYPCIVKPVDRSGSRAIAKVTNQVELESAIKNAKDESFLGKALVEEFIEGIEFSCECITYNGTHQFLAITKKYTTGAPMFIETGHVQPSGLNVELERKVFAEISRALDALQITQGATHAEFMLDENQQIKIIEIGARMGGDFIGSHLVKYATGYDFVGNVIKVACGIEPECFVWDKIGKVAVRFLFSKEDEAMVREYIANNTCEVICEDITCTDWDLPVRSSAERKGYSMIRTLPDTDIEKMFDANGVGKYEGGF